MERSDGDVCVDVPPDKPEEIVQVDAPVFRDHRAGHQHLQDKIPADDPCHDLADRRIGEGVGGTCHRNHRGEFRVAHDGRTTHDACDKEADDNGGTGVERRGLRADGEDAGAHSDGHAHDGQIPPGKVAFELMPSFRGLCKRLLHGLLSKYVHRCPLFRFNAQRDSRPKRIVTVSPP